MIAIQCFNFPLFLPGKIESNLKLWCWWLKTGSDFELFLERFHSNAWIILCSSDLLITVIRNRNITKSSWVVPDKKCSVSDQILVFLSNNHSKFFIVIGYTVQTFIFILCLNSWLSIRSFLSLPTLKSPPTIFQLKLRQKNCLHLFHVNTIFLTITNRAHAFSHSREQMFCGFIYPNLPPPLSPILSVPLFPHEKMHRFV